MDDNEPSYSEVNNADFPKWNDPAPSTFESSRSYTFEESGTSQTADLDKARLVLLKLSLPLRCLYPLNLRI